MIKSLDHVQLALPAGGEPKMLEFYELLGFTQVAKPAALAGRGGFWVTAVNIQLHFGVDPVFVQATKAHPAFTVSDLDALARSLTSAGHQVAWDTALPDVRRFFVSDPVGNRIKLMQA